MPDRTQAPRFRQPDQLKLAKPLRADLQASRLPLFVHPHAAHGVVKLSFAAHAGRWYAPQPALPYLMAKMLVKGTERYPGSALATYVDYHGADLSCDSDSDRMVLSMVFLSHHLAPMLLLAKELTTRCTFPEEALTDVKMQATQELAYAYADPATAAYLHGRQQAFGSSHPYGCMLTPAMIDSVTRRELQDFYKRYMWHGAVCTIEGDVESHACQSAAQQQLQGAAAVGSLPAYTTSQTLAPYYLPRKESLQAAIVLSKPTITRGHADYPLLYITQMLLGGYFGSRLMQTIREQKGYTYGIYSRLAPHAQQGYLCISTEVGNTLVEKTLAAVKEEIGRLQEQLVGDEELLAFKTYLSGSLLSNFDAPFALTDHLRAVQLHGLGLGYYENLYSTLWEVRPADIRRMARRYLAFDSFSQVVVGP